MSRYHAIIPYFSRLPSREIKTFPVPLVYLIPFLVILKPNFPISRLGKWQIPRPEKALLGPYSREAGMILYLTCERCSIFLGPRIVIKCDGAMPFDCHGSIKAKLNIGPSIGSYMLIIITNYKDLFRRHKLKLASLTS